jgi:D-alanyl-D-alanine carboxypeptidase (penicillin-binding protein 5/6)
MKLNKSRLALGLACLLLGLLVRPALGAESSEPQIALASKAAVLMDYASGRILFEKNAHMQLAPASVTKIMTLVLALEAVRDGKVTLTDLVPTSEYAASMGGTQIWLEPGEELPLEELLYAIAVGSANDAAVAVAEYLGGSEPGFVAVMNARAAALGMRDTHFANPSGLPPAEVGKDEPHVTSAYDMALLSRHALGLPLFKELTSTWGPVVMRPEGKRQPELWTYNKMMKSYQGMDGIKTGMTAEAGFCLAATAERDHLRLIAVTLGAPTSKERNADVARLLDYGFTQLRAVRVAAKGEEVGAVPVAKGRVGTVAVAPVRDVVLTVPRASKAEPEVEIVSAGVSAPIKKGQAVAEMIVRLAGEEVTRASLVALSDVPRGSLLQIMWQTMRRVSGGE